MNYRDYLTSALRHLKNCEFNIQKLNDNTETFDLNVRKAIEINTYYLGGYIIECLFSYALLHSYEYNTEKSVFDIKEKKFKELQWGVYFKDHSHNCQTRKYYKIVEKLGGQSSEIEKVYSEWGETESFNLYFQHWNSKLRYSSTGIEIKKIELESFISLIKKMSNAINRI